MKKFLLLIGLLISATACAGGPHGNPASIYCEQHGGQSVIVDGQGYCRLPSGQMCDEWAYKEGKCSQHKQDKKQQWVNYCVKHNGTAIGNKCHFNKQGTQCSLKSFYNGTCKKHHHKHPKVY